MMRVTRFVIPCGMILLLAGCGGQPLGLFERRLDLPASTAEPQATPQTSPLSEPPAEGTVGAADPFVAGVVNPDEDGGPDAAAAPSDGRLGNTVAALGDPGQSGFWLRTPLVNAPTTGRVVYVTSGRSVQVELLPLEGPAGGGSQISMDAMRLLDAPLTSLPELVVYQS